MLDAFGDYVLKYFMLHCDFSTKLYSFSELDDPAASKCLSLNAAKTAPTDVERSCWSKSW